MPDGSLIGIPNGRYLTGTNDFLIYIDEKEAGSPYDVWVYDIPTGESYLLQTDMDVYVATTDGELFYTVVPWGGGRTDCYRLIFDETGKLAVLELLESDI